MAGQAADSAGSRQAPRAAGSRHAAYAAAVAALSCFAIAGRRAGALADGPGSFAWRFLDALAALRPDDLVTESPLRP